MSARSMYLAKYRITIDQRAHFSLFIPNAADDKAEIPRNFKDVPYKGTIIHVVGEPLMTGYILQFKRNYDCSAFPDLRELVLLGYVNTSHIYNPESLLYSEENTPRAQLEWVAATVSPPPKGQNIRAAIDGVSVGSGDAVLWAPLTTAQINTKRCQEWTMEYLQKLVDQELIRVEATSIAQSQRDSPTHGIFGQKDAVRQQK